jgi:hypothetical protein
MLPHAASCPSRAAASTMLHSPNEGWASACVRLALVVN